MSNQKKTAPKKAKSTYKFGGLKKPASTPKRPLHVFGELYEGDLNYNEIGTLIAALPS
ncbi:MAG: hypothetical protein V4692_10160 [Bdellovibrionota bacterium]